MNKNSKPISSTTQTDPDTTTAFFNFDAYVEALWTLDYLTPNVGKDGRPIVFTHPCRAPIRVTMLALLEKNGTEWRAAVQFRYWGSEDPSGRDDHKSGYYIGHPDNDAEALRSGLTDTFRSLEAYQAATTAIVRPLRYVSVRGRGDDVLRALQSVGMMMTVVPTGSLHHPTTSIN